MARFYFQVEGTNTYYEFNAPAASYPTDIRAPLGVIEEDAVPDGANVTNAGIFSDWGIMRIALRLDDGRTRIRLCDVNNFSSAVGALVGQALDGAVIRRVRPVRRQRLI